MGDLVSIPLRIWEATSGLSPLARGVFFQLYGDAAQAGGWLLWNGRPITARAAANKYAGGHMSVWIDAMAEMLEGGLVLQDADGMYVPAISDADKEAERASARERQAAKRSRDNSVTPVSRPAIVVVDDNESKKEESEDQQQQSGESAAILAAAGVVGKTRQALAAKLPPPVASEIVKKARSGRPRNLAGLVVELCRDEIETGEIGKAHATARERLDAAARQAAIDRQNAQEASERFARAQASSAEANARLIDWWRSATKPDRQQLVQAVAATVNEAAARPMRNYLDQEITPMLANIARPIWESGTYAN